MDTHVKNLGYLSMAFGLCATVGALIILIWAGGITGLFNYVEDQGLGLEGLGMVAAGSVLLHLLVGVPYMVLGYYLLRYEDWARSVMIVFSGLNLLNVPIGSVLSIYGLWVLMTHETDPLFRNPLSKLKSRRPPLPPPRAARASRPESIGAPPITPAESHQPE